MESEISDEIGPAHLRRKKLTENKLQISFNGIPWQRRQLISPHWERIPASTQTQRRCHWRTPCQDPVCVHITFFRITRFDIQTARTKTKWVKFLLFIEFQLQKQTVTKSGDKKQPWKAFITLQMTIVPYEFTKFTLSPDVMSLKSSKSRTIPVTHNQWAVAVQWQC